MNDNKTVAAGCFLVAVSAPLIGILRGWVASVLWGWFVTPVFGLRPPHLALILGLSTLVSMFVAPPKFPEEDEDAKRKSLLWRLVRFTAIAFGAPLISLLMGAIFHWFAR